MIRGSSKNLCPSQWMFIGVSFGAKRTLRRRIMSIATPESSPRGRGWSALGLLLVLIVGCAALTDKQPPPPGPAATAEATASAEPSAKSAETEAMRATREKLRQPIPLRFDATPLEEVIAHLRKAAGVNIAANWRALEKATIYPDTPVTLNIVSIPVEGALQQVLDTTGGDVVPLGYYIDESGMVQILPRDILPFYTQIRTYDIRDLLVVPAPLGEPNPGKFPSWQPKDSPEPSPSGEELMARMSDMIRNTIDPENWRESGGRISSLNELNGTLIVNTTEENHAAIVRLLNLIREPRRIRIQIETRFLLMAPETFDEHVRPLLKPAPDANGRAAEMTGIIDAATVQGLLRVINSTRRSTAISAPRLTMSSGQAAELTIGTPISYTADYTREKDGALKPMTKEVLPGAHVNIEAFVTREHTGATLIVNPTLSRVVQMHERPFDGGLSGANLIVQTPQMERLEMNATATVPSDVTLVLAGPVTEITPDNGDGMMRRVVVLVKPTILLPDATNAEPLIPGAGAPQKAVLHNRD